MEELKVQNSLLLQLINSKNRQNQILFQQYEQLAADNRQLQTAADHLRHQNNELKRQPTPASTLTHTQDYSPRRSPFDQEIAELKKRNQQLQDTINGLKAQLEERGGSIILLENELQKAKLEQGEAAGSLEQLKEAKELLGLKEQSVLELTEYMQVQAEKISELTRASIIAIDNYEAKITEKDAYSQQLNSQIAQLNEQIEQLNAQQHKEAQLEESPLKGEPSVDQEKVKELETIILSKEQSIAELSEFLQAQSDKVSTLQNSLSESNIQALQDEINHYKQIVDSKEQSIIELSQFLNTLSVRNQTMEEKLQKLQEETEQTQKPIIDVERTAQLQSQILSLQQEGHSLVREAQILRAKLSTREDEVELLTRKLDERQAEMSELRVQLDDKVLKITMLESISEQNDPEFPNDQQQPALQQHPDEPVLPVEQPDGPDYEGLLQLKSSQIETLKATIEQKDQSLRDFTDFISLQTDKIKDLEAKVDQQTTEFEAIIKSKDQSLSELSTFLEESYAKTAEIDSCLRQSQENQLKIKQELDELKNKATENAKDGIHEDNIQVSSAQPEPQAKQQSEAAQPGLETLQERIKQLEDALTAKTQTIIQLSQFMDSQAESLRNYKRQEEEAPSTHRISELEAIINMKQQSNSELAQFLEEAYAKIAQAELSLAEAQNRLKSNEASKAQEQEQIIAQQSTNDLKPNELADLKQETPPQNEAERDLREQIKELESTLASKDDNILELTQFMSQQAEELERLTQQVEAQNAQGQHSSAPSQDQQELKRQLTELQLTLANKDENINELTEFMSQQAQELEELRERLGASSENKEEQPQASLLEKIATLEEVVRLKELSQSQTNQFLQEAYSKIAALEEEKAEAALKKAEAEDRLNEHLKKLDEVQNLNKSILAQLDETDQALNRMTAERQNAQSKIVTLLEQQERLQPPEPTSNEGEDVQALKATIQELEDVVNTKTQTIAELSEFMNEQSLQMEELEEKLNGRPEGSDGRNERIDELETIIKSKEASIAELTQFLEEAYAKNAELQSLAAPQQQQSPQEMGEAEAQQKQETQAEDPNYQAKIQLQAKIKEDQDSLIRINSQLEQRSQELSEVAGLLEETARLLAEQQEKLQRVKAEAEEAQTTYNAQVDDYNQHCQIMQADMASLTQTLEALVQATDDQEHNYTALEEQAEKLKMEIQQLQQSKQKQASVSLSTPVPRSDESYTNSLQAKITEYEGFLNDREEEMAAMMEVMENLQAEISSKNEIINHLQETNQGAHPNPPDASRVQELEEEISSLKQTIQELQGIENQQRQQTKLQGRYGAVEVEQDLMEESNKLRQQYQQELRNMKNEQYDLERELNLDGNFNAQEEVENSEQLTVLQVIEQILVYSEDEVDMASLLRMIDVLKKSYLSENQCILKENTELKDTLNNLLEINNNLVEEIEKIKTEAEELRATVQEQEAQITQTEERAGRLESNYQQEIKQLRKSITGLREESPIGKQEELNTINRLEDEVVALRQENQQKEVELTQLKANSNKKFVNELNNLLDSCTVAKDGEDLREMEEELERLAAERDEMAAERDEMAAERDEMAGRCKEYEAEVASLQKKCEELASSLENARSQPAQSHIQQTQNTQGQDSLQTAELLAGLEEPLHQRHTSELEEQSADKWRAYNEELQGLLQEKNAAINELEETMLGLEKGYNSEIMSLRRNIAELKSEAIALRKSLYQANPNGVDIGELIKDTFNHAQRDTDFYRPAYPAYTHSLFLAHAPHNNSYYSDAQHPRHPQHYQRYFAPSPQLTLGEKFMGRRCRQASPFGYGDGSRATAWEAEMHRY